MGFTLTDNWSRITAGDLEYIPDRPDFIDGIPVVTDDYPKNEIHTGELPSEQDPRDKVEAEGDQECESFELIFTLPEAGDMTDLIEDWITAQRTGVSKSRKRTKSVDPISMSDEDERMMQHYAKTVREKHEKNYLDYNVFNDSEVRDVLKMHGLTNSEIDDYARLREKHLYRAQDKSTDPNNPRDYQWGQGLGQKWIGRGDYQTPPALNLDPYQQQVYRRWKPQGQQRYQNMSPEERKQVWNVMQKKYPQFWGNQAQKHQQEQEIYPLASRKSLERMRNHVNLIGGILGMPRTAHVLREAADLVSAVRELDNGGPLDEVTKSALRNTSRNLLAETDHLKSVNNRIANRVAGEIEQLYVDSLSN